MHSVIVFAHRVLFGWLHCFHLHMYNAYLNEFAWLITGDHVVCLYTRCWQSQGTVTSCSSSSVGVNVMSSSNNDVISGESDMAAGAQGGNERSSTTGPSGGRRFRLLPSLHNVLFPGCRRQRGPSPSAGFQNEQTEQLPRGLHNQGASSTVHIFHEKM